MSSTVMFFMHLLSSPYLHSGTSPLWTLIHGEYLQMSPLYIEILSGPYGAHLTGMFGPNNPIVLTH